MKKSTSQLGISPELHAKRKKQEGEDASVKACTSQLVTRGSVNFSWRRRFGRKRMMSL